MKTFKDKLEEAQIKDALRDLDPQKYRDLKDAYYKALDGLQQTQSILGSLVRGKQITPFTKDFKIIKDVFKTLDRSDFSKFL